MNNLPVEREDGGFRCKVIKDSVAYNHPGRLTTLEIKYPRFIHAEILTHRDRARNAESSRAIPWPKMMVRIENEPVVPIQFGAEQRGMQTGEEIAKRQQAEDIWLAARDDAVKHAQALANLGVHKSICNRITEPWMWVTVVMTSTEWKDFFRIRCHEGAEIHFQKIACMMRECLKESTPEVKIRGEWHLPYTVPEDFEYDLEIVKRASVARCNRVSNLTHDGKRDIPRDMVLFDRLVQGSGFVHWSPFEHVATPGPWEGYVSGPFFGWIQYRKNFMNENAQG